MKEIEIKVKGTELLSIDKISLFNITLKKHSEIDIQRLADSIVNDGFLFPIAVAKSKDKNLIIDGECRYYALKELIKNGYEINEIPVYYVKATKSTIKKILLIATSVNHCVTDTSLKDFVKDTDINLKDFAFESGVLLDFWSINDFDLYEFTKGGKFSDSDKELQKEDFIKTL